MCGNIPHRVYKVKTPSIFVNHMSKDIKPLLNRLSRAEGQIRSLRQGLEAGKIKDCKAFITQLKAARAALKSVGEQFVLDYIHQCQSLPKEKREKSIGEALKILSKD